jgi:hypothetical protein
MPLGPGGPSLGLEGDILFLEIVIFCLGGAAKLRWAEGRAAPRWAWQRAQNDGCAHAPLKPTSLNIYSLSASEAVNLCK